MNNEQLEDLKQFITATVSQQTAELGGDIAGLKNDVTGIKGDIKRLEGHMSDRFDGVDEQLNEIQNAVGVDLRKIDTILEDHTEHLRRLDHKLA